MDKVCFWVSLVLCLGGSMVDGTDAGSDPMKVNSEPGQIRIKHGTQAILTYQHTPGAFKPYVKELYSPNGRNILLDSPSDHVHHHGLMLAYNADGINFWEENPQCGFQIQQQGLSLWSETVEPKRSAGLSCDINWQAPAKQVVLQETRSIEAHAGRGIEVNLVTWTSRLRGARPGQDVQLTGSHYFGLGMRFVRAMDKTGTFINAKGDPGTVFRGDERLARGRWCAYQVDLDGQEVTVAMFDHPENPRPATWFTMKTPFAYLAATLNLHEEPYGLAAGDSLSLHYGVAVWDGRPNAQDIEEQFRHWLGLQKSGND